MSEKEKALDRWRAAQKKFRALSDDLHHANGAGAIEQEYLERRIRVAASEESVAREEYLRLQSVLDQKATRWLSYVGAGLGILLSILKLIELIQS